jgi:hypothetical protein
MRPSYKRITRMNNSVDAATSSICWGKRPNTRYLGVAGKGGATTNCEWKSSDREEK